MAQSDSDSDSERVILSARRRLIWEEIEIGEEELNRDWRIKCKRTQKNSERHDYYCAYGVTCPAKLRKKVLSNGIYAVTTNGLKHKNHRSTNFGLTVQQKDIVLECLKSGVTFPVNILMTFRAKKVEEPAKEKLRGFLARHHKKDLNSVAQNDIGDVISWCKANENIPDCHDRPFVVAYDVGDTNSPNCHLRIFISTKRLLKFASFFKHIHADATYKLVYQGYPILLAGVTDVAKSFHPSGVALCKAESTDDYTFLFKSLKKGVEMVSQREYQPNILIADCADAITNGFETAFGTQYKRIFCYYHVIAAIDRRLHSVNLKRRKLIRLDITLLRNSPSQPSFEIAAKLFIAKWREAEPKFIDYFVKQWVETKSTWFLGYTEKGVPTTNNALESTNRYIKDLFTKRRKRLIGEFLTTTTQILSTWSEMRSGVGPNSVFVQYRLVPEMKLLKAVDAWLKSKPVIAYKKQGSKNIACVRSDGGGITRKGITKLISSNRYRDWITFQDYVDSELDTHKIFYSESDYAPDFICTCTYFIKNYICVHTIGIATSLDKFTLPEEATTGGLGIKRGPGRPKKITKALLQ